jgi:uncharacterized integral membrane protein (TIGR00697 family)
MQKQRQYRYFDLIMAAFVTVLLCSNLIGVHKVSSVDLPLYGEYVFSTGILFFPLSYLFGDILTEVYGYARSRKVIWAGFVALIFASIVAYVVTTLPAHRTMSPEHQAAVNLIFGQTWRIVLASLLGFWAGEFVNSLVLAKLKVRTAGNYLWLRTIGSTIAGEAVDTVIFYPIAFLGTWPTEQVISVMIGNYFIKVFWEVVATPLTYRIVAFLKRTEHEDFYDRQTDFNPFSLGT